MNKLEHLSLNFSLKPSKPFINECFFPLIHEKYITLDTNNNKNDRPYRHWNEVISLIKPFLSSQNIQVIRLGSNNIPVDGVINKFDLTKNQNSYIIKNSLLHLNPLNFFSYIASSLNTPLFSLFSGELQNEFSFPTRENNFFYDNSDEDASPSEIAESILSYLQIENSLEDIEYLCSGPNSHIKTIEFIPDSNLESDLFPRATLNIRADLSFDENHIYSGCNGRKVGLVCKNSLSENLVYSCIKNIQRVSYNVDDGIDDSFLNLLKKYNINYEMFCTTEKKLPSLRLKHLDETIEYFPYTEKKDLDKEIDLCNNCVFTTSKILISKNKTYPSKAHWITNNSEQKSFYSVIDTSDFWHDCDFINLYKTKKHD